LTAIFAKKFSYPKQYNIRRGAESRTVKPCTARVCAICDWRINMATKIAQQETVSTKLVGRWEQVCQKLAALAEEIPANKFDYKPVDGVRTVAEILRHAAFWNLYVADAARGKKGNDTDNELSPEKYSNKKQIIDALTSSAAEAAKALREAPAELSPEMLETLVGFIEHNCEHYGQLAVYARMNKIVPPTSRG
jgi:uncharacterized damage-inducible protein DinB